MTPRDSAPRVSVVMGVFNGARFLDEAIESIVSQDYRDFEFVIVDDGSTDRTPEILARWAALDPRIVLLQNEVNAGHSMSLNRGMRQARGEWIARQDADDVSEPGRLSGQMAWIDSHPGVVLVSTDYRIIDERGSLLRNEGRADRQEVIEFFLRFGNVLGGATQVMFRRDEALAVGGFNESYRVSEDYDLWTRLARRGDVVVLPFYGMRYRVHARSATSASQPEDRMTALRVVQRELGDFLGRPVEEDEATAVRVIGGQLELAREPLADSFRKGEKLFDEGYRRLASGGAANDVLNRIRKRTASRFGATAVLAALMRHDIRGAVLGLAAAARWHPVCGLVGAARVLWRELIVRTRVLSRRVPRPRPALE